MKFSSNGPVGKKRLWKAKKKNRSVNQHDLQSGTNPEPFLLRVGGGTMATEEPRSTSCWSLPPFHCIIIISIFALGGMCLLDPLRLTFRATYYLVRPVPLLPSGIIYLSIYLSIYLFMPHVTVSGNTFDFH